MLRTQECRRRSLFLTTAVVKNALIRNINEEIISEISLLPTPLRSENTLKTVENDRVQHCQRAITHWIGLATRPISEKDA